ncbi:hypothetical protein V5799_007404 [Amblyomma americanum]|uniref:Secreted protein n=1 Tax=Amblyomma americanum TaxID=6943 RepID=A0AAQ4FHH9_AMBAM
MPFLLRNNKVRWLYVVVFLHVCFCCTHHENRVIFQSLYRLYFRVAPNSSRHQRTLSLFSHISLLRASLRGRLCIKL